jgi:hypothetical protein
MARALRSIPAALAALCLAAHFFRSAAMLPAAVCVAAIALLFVTRAWATQALRSGLAAGSLIWIVTAWRIARTRMDAGMPYLRMLAILGAVAAFTALAAWLLPGGRSPREAR